MNNKLLNIITGKDRRRYNQIIQLIEQKNYSALFDMDKDQSFGLSNQKYVNRILDKMEQEISKNPEFLMQMNQSYYQRANYFNEIAIKSNPKIIESFIEQNILRSDWLISNEELFKKALDWGFIPSLKFLNETKLLNNPNLTDRILDIIELTPEVINSPVFFGNEKAQLKIIKERPDLLLRMNYNSAIFEQIWIEAFKQGYVPKEILNNYFITGNLLLFSKVIKQHPEMIKYCQIRGKEQQDQIDELALCMGYVPSLSDVQNSEYVRKSSKLMQALILRRPEAIKYANREISGFFDLIRSALNNGYIPTLKDVEYNPSLADSFDIMKILVQENPELINIISVDTPNKEELLKIAIGNGFNGTIVEQYKGDSQKNEL